MIKIGTYGIGVEEFMDGHLHTTKNKETDMYGFEEFLRDFEGDISAQTVADAWNKLAEKHGWTDTLEARETMAGDE